MMAQDLRGPAVEGTLSVKLGPYRLVRILHRQPPPLDSPKHPLRKSWYAFTIFLSGVQFPRLNGLKAKLLGSTLSP
jgi:hypothetical protein